MTNNVNNFSSPLGITNGGLGASSFTPYAPIVRDSGQLVSVDDGFSNINYVLTGTGTVPKWHATPALALLDTITFSNTADADFTLPTEYTMFMVNLNGVINSASTDFVVYFSNDNGSTYILTGYLSAINFTLYNSAARNVVVSAGLLFRTGLAGRIVSGSFYLYNSINPCYVGQLFGGGGVGGPLANNIFVTGSNNNSGPLTNIRITCTAGTYTTGTVSLYGFKA